MIPTNKQPLFIITGASCVGKTSACSILFHREHDYIVMESDLLWNEHYNTPEDNYCEYRRLWMRTAASIAHVVLCGCAVPEQFETQPERNYFTNIHYLAVVCDDICMEQRICTGRGISDTDHIKNSKSFNKWLRDYAGQTSPSITLLDNSDITPEETADIIDEWIRKRMDT